MLGGVAGRYTKVWEGQEPYLVLQVHVCWQQKQVKAYLQIDTRTRHVGLTFSKPEALKLSGSVANLLRKHAPAGGVGRILREKITGGIWIPLYTQRNSTPTFYLHLSDGSPAELSFVDAHGKAMVRRSPKGSFTKVKLWEGLLPHQIDDQALLFDDVTDEVFARLTGPAGAEASRAQGQAALLPDYQRVARDRLARRIKTLKKFLANRQGKAAQADEINLLEQKAHLLAAHLHRVQAGDFELNVDGVTIDLDPDKSPGHNLDDLYVRIKKTRKTLVIATDQAQSAERQLETMLADLEQLRAGTLGMEVVMRLLQRHKLPLERPTTRSETGLTPVAQLWRVYVWREENNNIPMMVGKSAAGSDALCRSARSNDWWLHAVGTTGSHVIIPARALRATIPSMGLIRAAAILALHFSQRKADQRGEVYLTRRHLIKKRPAMPAGLWQIDKAETIFVSYETPELQNVLAQLVTE